MSSKIRGFQIIGILFLMLVSGCRASSPPSTAISEQLPTPIPTRTPEDSTNLQLGDTQTRSRDGMKIVFVPAGQFEMGASEAELDQAMQSCIEMHGTDEACQPNDYRNSQPVHTVDLEAFWIDQTEVSNAQFAIFLNEQGNQEEDGVYWLEPGAGSRGVIYGYLEENEGIFTPRSGYEDYPVVEVSWYGAAAYCAWMGGRLPTEAEWEYDARGPESNIYPWGNAFDGKVVNYCDTLCSYEWKDTNYNDGAIRWTTAGSYPQGASWCGALDMSGNVWEWVSDWWSENYYSHSSFQNPTGPETGTLRVVRGGSWFEESWRVRPSIRKALTPSSYRMHWVGFRCVVSAQP